MEMISKGQIADRTRFNFENNNFDGEVEYYNGILYWIRFDENWNETGKKNLFEMFNIQSTMVADFEPIENEVDIDNIEKISIVNTSYKPTPQEMEFIAGKFNELVQVVKQLDKEIKSIKEK